MERTIDFQSHQKVSLLGYGAGGIGADHLDEDFVGSLLNQVVDMGIQFIDTARGYGLSEERIGRHLSYRRRDFILSTKVGYMVPGHADWTYDAVFAGVEQALGRMKTQYLDIVFLHSCPLDVLQKQEVVKALQRCKEEGLVKSIGYSGENRELAWALEDERFDVVQCSVNLTDQYSLHNLLPKIRRKKGVVAKRPLANAPWLYPQEPAGHYCESYWRRMKELDLASLKPENLSWNEFFLRFSLSVPEVSTAIVGSLNLEHIRGNLESSKKGLLPPSLFEKIKSRFLEVGSSWGGEI